MWAGLGWESQRHPARAVQHLHHTSGLRGGVTLRSCCLPELRVPQAEKKTGCDANTNGRLKEVAAAGSLLLLRHRCRRWKRCCLSCVIDDAQEKRDDCCVLDTPHPARMSGRSRAHKAKVGAASTAAAG